MSPQGTGPDDPRPGEPEPESADPPLRWPRGSAEEDFEAERATQLDELARWAREQRFRPLTDALEAHGMIREHREDSGRYIVPEWWAQAAPPEAACPRCETPGDPALCGGCADAQAADPDPPSLLAWWESMPAIGRRLYLSAAHGLDPWTGRAARVEFETTTIDAEAGVGVSRAPLLSLVPRTSWNLRRGG
jgi:hypothetical protein